MDTLVQSKLLEGVATLTLNRPEAMNALTDELIDELIQAIESAGADPDIGCIIITGKGRSFCAGGDVKGMATDNNSSFNQKLERLRGKHKLAKILRDCPKVTIAMLNGPAIGAGLGLSLCCDFRLIATKAYFGPSFVKLGIATDFGVAWLLPRLVGDSFARECLLRGNNIDAATALAKGLVSLVAEAEDLTEATLNFARQFAAGPKVAQCYIKRNLNAATDLSFEELLDMEAIHQVSAVQSSDHQEALRAFMEKRAPVFRGDDK